VARIAAMSSSSLASLGTGIDSDFTRSLLDSIALFRGVDPETIADLLPRCGRVDIVEGDVLLSPERTNRCVYVVLSGRLSVHLGSLHAPKIADLAAGSCAGEMSLIEDKDPSAYVIAVEDSHLMVISHHVLWHLVDRSHTFSKNLLVVLSERVRSDNEFIASSLGVLRQAERNALSDGLTGLGNRHWMKDMFEREVTRARTSATSLCLMMIDIDNFKRFNDQYGHIAGDRVLVAVSEVLREHLRPTDLVARFGGDEFAALLPGIELRQGQQTAERLREHVANLSPPSLATPITISIGVSTNRSDDDVASLVARADGAMYEAKDGGRNRVAVRGESNTKVVD
jgi:diguanylate cyclase (GGDEF)-like protein